jgi:hypothetical protein
MKKATEQQYREPEFFLTRKEKTLEFMATAMCFLLLLGCFLKVLFF